MADSFLVEKKKETKWKSDEIKRKKDLFKNYSYLIELCAKEKKKNSEGTTLKMQILIWFPNLSV